MSVIRLAKATGVISLLLLCATACGGDPAGQTLDLGREMSAPDRSVADHYAETSYETQSEVPQVDKTYVLQTASIYDGAAGVTQIGKFTVKSVTGFSVARKMEFDSYTLQGGVLTIPKQ